MASWPSIPLPSYGFECEVYYPQVRTPFEANYVQSRPKVSREIRRFNLKWNAMTEANYQTLETFFLANQGNSFNGTSSITGSAGDFRFSGDGLTSSQIAPGIRSVSCPIEEV